MLTVGLDWGSEKHAVCVFEAGVGKRKVWEVAHSTEGLDALVAELQTLDVDGQLPPVAIERKNGLLVARLLAEGFTLHEVNPRRLKALRDAYGGNMSRSKNDRLDAAILAQALATNPRDFPVVQMAEDRREALLRFTEAQRQLKRETLNEANRLRCVLQDHWPALVRRMSNLTIPMARVVLALAHSHEALEEQGLDALHRALREAKVGSVKAADLWRDLLAGPSQKLGPALNQATQQVVALSVARLEVLAKQLKVLEAAVEEQLEVHPEAKQVQALPCAGSLLVGRLLAKMSGMTQRFASREHLCAVAGMSPVQRSSGKLNRDAKRRAFDRDFHQDLYLWAGLTRAKEAWARSLYDEARKRGARHPHAVRVVARAWLRVLWACFSSGVPYESARKGCTPQAA